MNLRQLLLPLASSLVLLGCDPSDRGHRCEDRVTNYPLAEMTPSQMSGQAFGKRALGEHKVTISPEEQDPGTGKLTLPSISPDTPATLTVELAPNATFSHILSTYIPCARNAVCTADIKICQDQFALPVRVRLTAPNGAIDEVWEGELRGLDPKDPDPNSAQIQPGQDTQAKLRLLRPAESFTGAFKVGEPQLKPGMVLRSHDIALVATFEEGKLLSAQLMSYTETRDGKGKDAMVGMGRRGLFLIKPAP